MNTLLLTNYKHMALMHSRQPGCRPITKTTESTKKKEEETGDGTFGKTCFQNKLTYDNKNLLKVKYNDNTLRNNAFRWVSKSISFNR